MVHSGRQRQEDHKFELNLGNLASWRELVTNLKGLSMEGKLFFSLEHEIEKSGRVAPELRQRV